MWQNWPESLIYLRKAGIGELAVHLCQDSLPETEVPYTFILESVF